MSRWRTSIRSRPNGSSSLRDEAASVPVVLVALADSDPLGDVEADRLRAGAGTTAGATPPPSPTPSLPDCHRDLPAGRDDGDGHAGEAVGYRDLPGRPLAAHLREQGDRLLPARLAVPTFEATAEGPGALYGPHELQAKLGVGRSRMRMIIRHPTFPAPYQKLHGTTVWLAAEVDAWIAEHREPKPPVDDDGE
jgi:prophage regulatory protein